jgi:hypothetical protein
MLFSRPLLAGVLIAATTATAGVSTAGPGQLPVGQGGRATPNVRLLANIPTGTGTGGTFLGSTYFITSADTAWFSLTGGTVPTTGGLVALDASNPEQPVPIGSLPLPHYENEDLQVSAKRQLLVISQDRGRLNPLDSTSPRLPGREYLVDVSVPSAMRLLSMTLLPAEVNTGPGGAALGGPGHTATLVGNDQYLWVGGSRDRSVWVVDIRDAAAPKVLGSFLTPAGADLGGWTPGIVHDVDVDQYGDVWVTGSGGTALYTLTQDPLHPKLIASVLASDNRRLNQYIHHGSQRLDRDHVLVTEEDYQTGCNSSEHQDGSLSVWRIDRLAARLVPVSEYDAPKRADDSGPLSSLCSSHWFSINKAHVVADAWYGAGVRFLDVSDPKHPRPIGTWAGDSTIASQARFVPGRDDLVYVADYERGLDVVQIDNGGRSARTMSPADEKPVAATPGLIRIPGSRLRVRMHAHEDFGWVCAVPTSV